MAAHKLPCATPKGCFLIPNSLFYSPISNFLFSIYQVFKEAISRYLREHGYDNIRLKAVLFDMDGVLFNSMPYHADAWHTVMERHGLHLSREEAYMHEGRTGAADNDSNVINPDGTLFVKSDYKIIRINVNQIKYIECMSEYVRIYLEGEDKPVMTLLSMRKLEERLPASMFMRVHRSYIVNLHKIQEISRLRIIFEGNVYIPVGDNYKEKFNDYINKMCLGK
jgi:hypothetical protein